MTAFHIIIAAYLIASVVIVRRVHVWSHSQQRRRRLTVAADRAALEHVRLARAERRRG